MPEDLSLFLICVGVGLSVGLALRLLCPHCCKRYAAWSASRITSRRWWVFVFYASFFLLLASALVGRHWYSFGSFSVVLAAGELVMMAITLRRRASSAKQLPQ
jgi:hypothetical protein